MRTVAATLRASVLHTVAALTLLSVAGWLPPASAVAAVSPVCTDKPIALIKGVDRLVKTYEGRTIISPTQSVELRTFTRIAKQTIFNCEIHLAVPQLDGFVAYTVNLRDVLMVLSPDQAARLIDPIIQAKLILLAPCVCTPLTAEAGEPTPTSDDAAAAPPCDKGLVVLQLLRVTIKDWRNLGTLSVDDYATMDAQLLAAHTDYTNCQVASALHQVRSFMKYVEWLYRIGVLNRAQANELLDLAEQASTIISTCGC